MTKACSRRQMLRRTTCAALAGAFGAPFVLGASRKSSARSQPGVVVGEEIGAAVGQAMLTNGGNAIDALVAGALASCVANPSRCGIGGYGGHAIIALAGGKKVTAIDFNSMAPAGARPDMYPLDETGEVKGRINFYGWLAAGVPGTLAGLYLALERYGTRPFREVVKPAIELARKGFVISPKFARTIQGAAARFRNDPGSAKLYLKNGEPCPAGELLRNPDLADLLSTLAKRNSMDAFYRGDVARSIAESFEKNGGLVTAKDLAAYHAREVTPLLLKSNEFDIYTAPLTAGGLTVLEGLSILRALPSEAMAGSAGVHARLEAMRLERPAGTARRSGKGERSSDAVALGRLCPGNGCQNSISRNGAATSAHPNPNSSG